MVAEKPLPAPKTVEVTEIVPNKAAIGKQFKKEAKTITDYLSRLSLDDVLLTEKQLAETNNVTVKLNDHDFVLNADLVSIKRSSKTVHVEEFIPSVIEPSFGIGRIMYALLEQQFKQREGDEQRCYFTLPPIIAPLKCSVLPLSNHTDFQSFVKKLSTALTHLDVSHKVDDASGSIGKRYARTDEVAIPFGITIDFDTLKEPHTVTLRERDTMTQVRIPVQEVAETVKALSLERIKWEDIQAKYPKFEQQESVQNKE